MIHRRFLPLCLAAGLALAGPAAAQPPGKPPAQPPRGGKPAQAEMPLPPLVAAVRKIEVVEMLEAILSGSDLQDGNCAWFHPSQSRYDFKWLLERFDADHDGAISRKEFAGPTALFERLDRNHDGRISRVDFDWSEDTTLNRQMMMVGQIFRRADADKDGRLTAKEWQAMFEQAARGKDGINREELHALLFPAQKMPTPQEMAAFRPSPLTLLRGVLTGELGSACEGPALGQMAPDFTLKTHDGEKEVSLHEFRGKKPVVLVFGSFT